MKRSRSLDEVERNERRRAERDTRQNYKMQKTELKRRMQEEHFRIQREMFRELHRMQPESHHCRRHRERDFEHYYKRMKFSRPISIIFILLLWLCLFMYGGFQTGLSIVILIFAVLTSIGYIFQFIFFSSLQKRILMPIQRLKKAVDDVSKGHYDISVDEEGATEIQSLISDFNAMVQKLKENENMQAEYEENRKQLIASISHDIKTPITSVLGYTEAISDAGEIPPEKLEKYLKIINNNIAYMNKLIDDLFLFSKLDMQKLPLEFSEISVAPFLWDMMEEFKLDLDEKAVKLEYTDELSKSFYARIDPKRFYQVIRNIVDNAVKYGDEHGLKITARLYNDANYIYLSLSNNGHIIPADKLPHIFERFYRLDTARTKDISSTGLGLAIAKELMEAHGGKISAANIENTGTCFTLSLPILTGEKRQERAEN